MTQRTKRQQVAYERPYFEDVDAVSSEHTNVIHLGDARISSVLTVERQAQVFGGRPAWHASAAVRGSKNAVPLHRLSEAHMNALSLVARALLAGVGAGEEQWLAGRVALHMRRALSDDELAGLDPSWQTGQETGPD